MKIESGHNNGEYFCIDMKRCRLVRGIRGAALYDLEGGAVIPLPPSCVAHLHESIDCFRVFRELSPEAKVFVESLAVKGLGCFSASLPERNAEKRPETGCRPDFAWLEITRRCNLSCGHCYGSFGPSPEPQHVLTDEQWVQVLTQVKQCGFDRIQFIGGEPLLHPALPEMLFEAGQHRFAFVEVFSNLLLLDDTLLNAVCANHARLATTLYSVHEDVHDQVTGRRGSFSSTVQRIRRAREWGIPVRVSCVVSNRNEGRIGDLKSFVEDLGVVYGGQDQSRPSGRGQAAACRTTIPRRMVWPPFFSNHTKFAEALQFNPCWKGKIAVTDDGSVLPCVFSRECVAGNILTQPLSDMLSLDDGMKQYWHLNKDRIDVCRDCEFRYGCYDCRPLARGWGDGQLTARTFGCSYDPYSGRWR